jgi:pyruvate dehydrogenase kinase 2/3/4
MTVTSAQDLSDQIHYLAQFKQRPLSLKQLFEFGSNPSPDNLLIAAQFLHKELPVRLAHRTRELEKLPFGLSEMPSVRLLREMYRDSFRILLELPCPRTIEEEWRFTGVLGQIKQRHNNVVSIMAKGIQELKHSLAGDTLNPRIQEFLDCFYMSRIGVRTLIGQHVALHQDSRLGFVGLICEKCSPAEVAEEAIANARSLCLQHYSVAPQVGLFGKTDLTFTYVPSHLHHMLFELLKNSMRAVVELHRSNANDLPLIRIAIAEGHEDATIKVSDEGGGIPRSGMSRIWTYLYTTAIPPDSLADTPYHSDFHAPFAGLGYGLPISRLYARYFGGDLQVISMEGYGTDAYLHLKRLDNTEALLPKKLY